MQFVYKPEGADPRSWEFNPAKLMSPEVEAIERHTGLTYKQWIEAVSDGSVLALHGLLYVLLKRTAPTLKWDEVQFCMDELDMQMDDDEVRAIRKTLVEKAATGHLSDEEAALLDSLPDVDEPAPKGA